jgi:mannan endo-1,6-alpha-mannosidase
LTLTN